ncbi:MAG TPA: hypothetical protein VGV35_16550 [Bryobacteraceae bacterium]|nr:hypothetical protein [Bryobacteraceae bacterium]
MTREIPVIPPNMLKVYQRLKRWRGSHTGRLPIPERLWTAATKLAREHGIFHTAKVLRLEYGKLKQLVEAANPVEKRQVKRMPLSRSRRARPIAPPAFVELIAPRPGSSHECRVELEGPRGRMRIEFKGIATAELVALSRALWDGEAR